MARFLLRAGIIVVGLSMVVLLLGLTGLADEESLAGVVRYGLMAGVALFALGLVLSFLGWIGGAFATPRCPRCRAPVRKGAIYCPDHLKETLLEAKDKYHRDHGSGM